MQNLGWGIGRRVFCRDRADRGCKFRPGMPARWTFCSSFCRSAICGGFGAFPLSGFIKTVTEERDSYVTIPRVQKHVAGIIGNRRRTEMTRRAAAVLLVLTLFPAVLYAQDTALTVTVQSADVYKGPSTGTPVIGHAPKGDVLPVVRNLGSWVQVAWVAAPDGIGYVHTTMGRLSMPNGSSPATTTTTSSRALSSPAPASTPAQVPLSTAQRTPASAGDRLPPSGQSGG